MKSTLIIVMCVFCAGAALAQSAAPQPQANPVITGEDFFLRFQRHDFTSPSIGIGSVCLLVRPDGKYRIERAHQRLNESKASAHVFEGELEQADLAHLREIVNQPDFRALRVMPSGIVSMSESYTVSVARADGIQSFVVTNETRRRLDKILKPFTEWERGVEKRKLPEAMDKKSTNCRFPRSIRNLPTNDTGDDEDYPVANPLCAFPAAAPSKIGSDGPGRGSSRKSI